MGAKRVVTTESSGEARCLQSYESVGCVLIKTLPNRHAPGK